MTTYGIKYPDGFDEREWESEAQGWLDGVILTVNHRRYKVTFYDPTRLAQDIDDELRRIHFYFEPNVILIRSVTRENIRSALEAIPSAGRHVDLVSEGIAPAT